MIPEQFLISFPIFQWWWLFRSGFLLTAGLRGTANVTKFCAWSLPTSSPASFRVAELCQSSTSVIFFHCDDMVGSAFVNLGSFSDPWNREDASDYLLYVPWSKGPELGDKEEHSSQLLSGKGGQLVSQARFILLWWTEGPTPPVWRLIPCYYLISSEYAL